MRYMVGIIALLLLGCADDGNSTADKTSAQVQPAEQVTTQTGAVHIWAENQLSIPLEALDEMFRETYQPGYQVTYWNRAELNERMLSELPPEADVILTGAQTDFETWLAAGLLDDEALRTIAGDSLVLIGYQGEGWVAPTLFDIYPLFFKWVGYGSENTLSGAYAHQALVSSGLYKRIDDRLQRFDSDVEVIAKVQTDELQMGIVLLSSIKQFHDLEIVVPISEDLHQDIRYRALVPSGHANEPGVPELLVFLAEDMQVQFNFEALGFARRENALVED